MAEKTKFEWRWFFMSVIEVIDVVLEIVKLLIPVATLTALILLITVIWKVGC